jgi:hypothetical protein
MSEKQIISTSSESPDSTSLKAKILLDIDPLAHYRGRKPRKAAEDVLMVTLLIKKVQMILTMEKETNKVILVLRKIESPKLEARRKDTDV